MDISLGLLLLVGFLSVISALIGALMALVGVWVWYTLRLVSRLEKRGASLYAGDTEDERARALRAADEMSTGIEFMRQALRRISPEMAREFTRDEPEKGKGK